MPARLIINADDFGLSPGVNRAIGELAEAGAISSATLMAGGESFDNAVETAKALPALGVGCHLVFVEGRPLSPARQVASLLRDDGFGFRKSLFEFAQAALLGRIRADEIELETIAQISRLQAAGLTVTHVDTHKHTHAFPAVALGVLRGAARCNVQRYRFPFEPRWSRHTSKGVSTLGRTIQMLAMQRMQGGFQNTARGEGVTTAGTLGILATGSMTYNLLEELCGGIAKLEGDSVLELCVHPGYVDDMLQRTGTRLLDSREAELLALMRLGAEPTHGALVHYGQLRREQS